MRAADALPDAKVGFGSKNEPATAGTRCARSGGLGEVHGTI
jgi:hypothetical protein